MVTTCKNCGKLIDDCGNTYFVHVQTGLVMCENGETQAEKR